MRLVKYEDRESWLAARRLGLGGTDVARVLGLAPKSWGGPMRVWAEKTGAVAGGLDENEAMRWGRLLEGVVAQEWAHREGRIITPVDGVVVHDLHDWARGTPDRLVLDHYGDLTPGGVLEVKTAGAWARNDWGQDGAEGTDATVPMHYLAQLVWYCGLAGIARGWFAVLIGGQELRSLPVEFDAPLFDLMLNRCGEWWRAHVETGTPPAPDGSPDFDDELRRRFPQAVAEVAHLDISYAAKARRLLDLKAQREAIDGEAAAVEQEIKAALGDAAQGQAGAYRLRWSNVAGRKSLDTKALAAAHPEIVNEFTRLGAPYRRFTIDEVAS